jgi:two-component system, OmpR family, sensor histidine kinase CpxA
LGVLLISALLWFPFVRGITRSIAQMTQATGQIAHGRFDVRVDAGRQDELGLLGDAINGMAVRLAELVRGQKQFLGNIAHELCSPLARLQVALGILDQRAGDPQRPYVSAACEKAEQIAALVNELLSFSKASLGPSCIKLEPVRVAEVVRKAAGREASEQVTIQTEVAEDLLAMAQPELLVRALSNLLRNALRYAGDAGPVEISARCENGDILLAVADHGPGVPEEHLPKLFDPFFRVDPSRDRSTGGVGLGLTIVKTCVAACNGSVLCRNRQPHGLEVLIRLSAAAVSDRGNGERLGLNL